MENKKIIEINGIKMEVDLRHAKRIDEFHVGDKVKILVQGYGNDYRSYAGVIVGFDAFENLPTIIVAYLKVEYNSAEILYAHINGTEENKKKYELVHINDAHELYFNEDDVTKHMDREIAGAEEKLRELKMKKNYFMEHFNKNFQTV
ncbi:MAG: hypothetical protein OEV78_12755 [Spirochaetia bacterium]|nr:hypothetical protein [Spirochaetia bacterium]